MANHNGICSATYDLPKKMEIDLPYFSSNAQIMYARVSLSVCFRCIVFVCCVELLYLVERNNIPLDYNFRYGY